MPDLIDDCSTPLGRISLERRIAPDGEPLTEVKINGYLLMSSLVDASETALAHHAFEAWEGDAAHVLVGGLGLGHTAHAALETGRVAHLDVVEYLQPVIRWHEEGLVSTGTRLADDARCSFVQADFFSYVGADGHPAPGASSEPCSADDLHADAPPDAPPTYDLILLDIDPSPRNLLHGAHGAFYREGGLRRMTERLRPGGVFGLWSWEHAGDAFLDALRAVFADVAAHPVRYHDRVRQKDETDYVYIARRPRGADPG